MTNRLHGVRPACALLPNAQTGLALAIEFLVPEVFAIAPSGFGDCDKRVLLDAPHPRFALIKNGLGRCYL